MNAPGAAAPFSRQALLRNGTPVHLRVVRPDDKDKLVAAFSKLDKESIYTRYFSFKKELSAAELDRLESNDASQNIALVVTLGAADEEIVIAAGSYVVHAAPDAQPTAEVAFTVEEDYQGQGIAGMLLDALAGIARDHGIARLDAEVLAGNAAMLAVFERSGLPLTKTREAGVIHVVMDLPRDRAER